MNWTDYEAAWKRQPLPKGTQADLSDLRATFETKRRKLAATLRIRDWSELAACGFLVVVYARYWQQTGPGGWPMAFAILLVLGVAAVFVRERLRVRRLRLGVEAPLLAKVEADLAELRHQRRMLQKIWAWYLGPALGAMLIHAGVILGRGKTWIVWEPLYLAATGLLILLIGALIAGSCWFVARLNRQAVVKNIEPRIAELEKLRQDILDPA
jgi:hypothetical protein